MHPALAQPGTHQRLALFLVDGKGDQKARPDKVVHGSQAGDAVGAKGAEGAFAGRIEALHACFKPLIDNNAPVEVLDRRAYFHAFAIL